MFVYAYTYHIAKHAYIVKFMFGMSASVGFRTGVQTDTYAHIVKPYHIFLCS